MHPLWYLLLHEQKYGQGVTAHGPTGKQQVGLTPSFLVGAEHNQPAEKADLRRMLESMMTSSSGELVHIAECDTIGQPRASLTDAKMGHLGEAVVKADGTDSRLLASPGYFAAEARDLESLTDGLWTVMGPAISSGRFSWRGGDWRPYESYELEFIDRARKKAEDGAL